MARKYDRYGRNRQFRRNPTRSRRFFPYQLPFQSDFRLKGFPSIGQYKRKRYDEKKELGKRKHDELEDDGYYQLMQYTQTPKKNATNSLIGAVTDIGLATVLNRAAQGYLKNDIAEIALRTALISGIITI